jgi:hypothetical protein
MTYDSRPDTYDHISRVRVLLLRAVNELLERMHVHDASKLFDPERATFDEYTPKLGDVVYGSDEYKQFLVEMRPALEHHYRMNRHHPEHFDDGIRGMNLVDVLEMLCDWVAASERTRDPDVAAAIRGVNRGRFGYGAELEAILLNTLPLLLPEVPPEGPLGLPPEPRPAIPDREDDFA